jgi:urease beta subunit
MIPRELSMKDRDRVQQGPQGRDILGGEQRRPATIQFGSDYLFFETNPALKFDRKKDSRHVPRYSRAPPFASSPGRRAR